MIRSTNHSSYPKLGASPTHDEHATAIARARAEGREPDAATLAAEDELTMLAVAEQCRAFVNVVTDGLMRWEGPMSRLARHIDGLDTGEPRSWLGTPITERQLVARAPLARRWPFLVHDYEVAAGVAQRIPVRVVMPGPVTTARLARDEHHGGLDALADALADVLAEETTALAAAGARHVQLDEPLLCAHQEDLERVVRTADRVFRAAGSEATTVLSTYFGALDALGDGVAALPGTHLGLDLTVPANAAVLRRLPPSKGVALGVLDVRAGTLVDAADLARALEPHRALLVERDVLVGPNAGLALVDRDRAFDTLLQVRYLAEQLNREWFPPVGR